MKLNLSCPDVKELVRLTRRGRKERILMKKATEKFYLRIKWIEFAIAVVIAVTLVFLSGLMIMEVWQQVKGQSAVETFNQLLSSAFTIIIGVEFIKMIIKPTSENVLEVIMLTIARSIIVNHDSMTGSLLGVLALLILFFTRKFLFCEIKTEDTVTEMESIEGQIVETDTLS